MADDNKEPTLPRILGSSQSFLEKVKNISNILGIMSQDKNEEENNPGNVTITGSHSQSKKMDTGKGGETGETESQKAQEATNNIAMEEEDSKASGSVKVADNTNAPTNV